MCLVRSHPRLGREFPSRGVTRSADAARDTTCTFRSGEVGATPSMTWVVTNGEPGRYMSVTEGPVTSYQAG
jgi:hypothetical protein